MSPEAAVFPADVVELVRWARRRADLSQRQLADAAGVSRSVVARLEGGGSPRWQHVLAVLAACGVHVALVDDVGKGVRVEPADVHRGRDAAGRRYPAHLDPREIGAFGDWYGDWRYQCWARPPRPPATYELDRARRDATRRGRGAQRLVLLPPARTAVPPPQRQR